MTYGPLSHVLRHIRRIAQTSGAAALEDRQLLERFITQRDEIAFESLLRRHGPMVLGVCQRLLHDPHDAEDAFQATFLVLLRKAGSLQKRELVAHWLYGVAYRTALKARGYAARRKARERQVVPMPEAPGDDNVVWNDLRPVLDEELMRLPEKYRLPVVLCYLEGKTLEEAALQLGWPAGTVSGRLARARELLRKRLTRRGVALSAGILGAVLAQKTSASLPPALLVSTLKSAIIALAGPTAAAGVISTSVVTLVEGVLKAMFMTKVKTAAVTVLVVAVLAAGATVLAYPRQPGPPADQRTAEKKADEPKRTDDKAKVLDELMKARLEAAETALDGRMKEFEVGKGSLDILLGASKRWLSAKLELSNKNQDRIAALDAHFERMKEIESENQRRFDAGKVNIMDLAQAKFYRLDAEIELERAKAK